MQLILSPECFLCWALYYSLISLVECVFVLSMVLTAKVWAVRSLTQEKPVLRSALHLGGHGMCYSDNRRLCSPISCPLNFLNMFYFIILCLWVFSLHLCLGSTTLQPFGFQSWQSNTHGHHCLDFQSFFNSLHFFLSLLNHFHVIFHTIKLWFTHVLSYVYHSSETVRVSVPRNWWLFFLNSLVLLGDLLLSSQTNHGLILTYKWLTLAWLIFFVSFT